MHPPPPDREFRKRSDRMNYDGQDFDRAELSAIMTE